ncbi:MAG TPA: hypothetical protein VMQ17_18935 [Candidatus Sulfotelmatobacter sp.]|nr:hypothetical protein [Candidatus Sulfotelmatobacter sp.]
MNNNYAHYGTTAAFVQFEQVARVATAVCLPEEPLAEAEIGNHLPSCAPKLVSFVVVGTLPCVGFNFGCRKIPSAEFGFQRYPRLIGKLLLLIGELEEFVFRQMLYRSIVARLNAILLNKFAQR